MGRKLYIGVFLLSLFVSGCASQKSPIDQAQISYSQKNYSKAFEQLYPLVQSQNPQAMYAMGYMYFYGVGTEKDQDVGRSLIRRSAAANYPPAVAALKLITQRRYNQYIPFEHYSKTQNEGIVEFKQPLLQGEHS